MNMHLDAQPTSLPAPAIPVAPAPASTDRSARYRRAGYLGDRLEFQGLGLDKVLRFTNSPYCVSGW